MQETESNPTNAGLNSVEPKRRIIKDENIKIYFTSLANHIVVVKDVIEILEDDIKFVCRYDPNGLPNHKIKLTWAYHIKSNFNKDEIEKIDVEKEIKSSQISKNVDIYSRKYIREVNGVLSKETIRSFDYINNLDIVAYKDECIMPLMCLHTILECIRRHSSINKIYQVENSNQSGEIYVSLKY